MLAPAMLVLAQALAPPSASAIPGGSAPGAPAASSPVGVTATASTAEVTVGEPFEIVLEATGPAGTEYTFAGEAQADALELRTKALGSEAPAPAPGTHRYDAVVFALGELQIPGIPVRYRLADGTSGEAASAPIPLKVVSLIPKDEADPKLADIRGPASLGIGRAFWIALALLLLLLAALTAWLLRRRRRADAPAAAPVPEIAPDEEALAALEALAREGLPAKGELRPFYIRLSAIAKRYLERRLGAPVLEMTSSETVGFLRAHPHGGELLPVIRDLAEQADRVKFARGEGVVPEAERHLASARALVPALEARLRPAAAEGQEKAA
jgi:cbb3-type cytochrome oxidase subunit 3